jgi:23S rRNA (guanine745-N1)-methyltransferase
MDVRPICPVRGCGAPLAWDAAPACPAGHRFDRARSGYVNLLQPQDRRSAEPGDPKAAVRARRRTVDRGLADGILAALLELVPAGGRALDVGCGEGFVAGALAGRGDDAWGVDLSAVAVDLAARRYPTARWIVANADRAFPFAEGSFDTVLSVTARKNPAETRRVLATGGRAIVAVSGERDLAELREVLLGRADPVDRITPTMAAYAGFRPISDHAVETRHRLDREALSDLMTLTYRGARHREQARFEGIASLDVTFHHRILVLA